MIRVLDAQFVTTAVDVKGYPSPTRPEIGFVGRSNVGKSSMINALAGRRKLVRVSNTPGRTRALNFFDVNLDDDGTRRELRLVDFPGYGFAKASKSEREQWRGLIDRYLEKGTALKIVVSIVDAEIGPTPDDVQMLDYLTDRNRRVLVVATQIDRLGKAQRKPRIAKLREQLELPEGAVVAFSAVDAIGVEEVWQTLVGALFDKR